MPTTIIIILGVVILMILLSPFLSKRSENQIFRDQGSGDQEKEYIFSQLADLEYDFQMGKLSETDFNKSKSELTAKATKFVQPTESRLEQTQAEVDHQIRIRLKKNGLEPKTEGRYES
ncbi:c-type cytochrome biogenesis protein CcmI [Halobacillus amylolyticus]|uniref:C-type cytochrome biogenesis protein CcmI n=1 Tax=Halobacillus amylolyticus TaxID=2932259 RepID=A0ABY4HB10_9BACI|nr:c-type cytochrome biogenesis protein CcmI [Halobacillus amylolyticus]UOR12068.1 c-type cytochrome biogenesis protein CcmI [Halobacillus amylolyticus]